MNCNKCNWFVESYIPLTHDEKEYIRLKMKYEGQIISFDKRICCLGGCKDGERFEARD